MSDLLQGQSIGERDEQAEEQWHRVNDKDWLLAEKHGYKSKDEYLKVKRRFERIETLVKCGASVDQATKEVEAMEELERIQTESDEKRLKEIQRERQRKFLADHLDANSFEQKIEMNLKELLNEGK